MVNTSERRIVAKVVDGRPDIDPSNRAILRRHYAAFEGREIDIVIRPHQRQRSLEQNAWIWGVAYPLIADHLGYDNHEHEDLHYALVAKCFGEHFDKRMGQMVPNKRSSKLSTREFSEYMEWLARFAATDLGVVIPMPDEAAA